MIIFYTAPTCHPCQIVKNMLDAAHLDYIECDVSNDVLKRQEMIKKTNATTVPVLDVDGEIVVGCDKRQILKLLALHGRA